MNQDPRYRNKIFNMDDSEEYLASFLQYYSEAISCVNPKIIDEIISLFGDLSVRGGQLFVAGNGGSAAISDHFVCDVTKGTHIIDQPAVRAHSLCSNTALYMAIANDFGLDEVFSKQLELYAHPDDVFVAISSSGNSSNTINGLEKAKEIGLKTVGLCGFSGGKMPSVVDICIHVNIHNYGIVEDAHMSILHIICQIFAARRDKKYQDNSL